MHQVLRLNVAGALEVLENGQPVANLRRGTQKIGGSEDGTGPATSESFRPEKPLKDVNQGLCMVRGYVCLSKTMLMEGV